MPKLHVKPTKAELEEEVQKAQEALDAPNELGESISSEPVPSEPSVDELVEEELKKVGPVLEPEVDYRKKFAESSREAQKIAAKNKVLNKAVEEAAELDEPTEEELQREFPDWELMDEGTRKIAKLSLISTKRFELVHKATEIGIKIEKWGEGVDKFVDDPATLIDNPDLEGKQDEFRTFANYTGNHGTDLKTLVSAFLYEESKKVKPVNKGAMFEVGSGGPNDKPKPKSDKISMADAEVLRKTDYNKWREFLKAGKIDNSEI